MKNTKSARRAIVTLSYALLEDRLGFAACEGGPIKIVTVIPPDLTSYRRGQLELVVEGLACPKVPEGYAYPRRTIRQSVRLIGCD